MANTMRELLDSAREEAREAYAPDLDIDRIASEMADLHTPLYHTEILKLALDDHSLALEMPTISGGETPMEMIQFNIYKRVYNAAYEELETGEDNDIR